MNKEMAKIFKMLGDENRLEILRLIANGQTCGCTLIKDLKITQPTLSYHLRVLTELGFIKAYKEGVWKKHYLNPAKLDEITAFFLSLKVQVGGHNE